MPTSGYNFYVTNTNPNGGGPAVIEGQSDTNSYGSFMPGGTTSNSGPAPGISYAQFNPTIEGTFANGTAGIKLELFRLTSSTGLGNPGTDLGNFTISNSGILTWTPEALAVPEPSTYARLTARGRGRPSSGSNSETSQASLKQSPFVRRTSLSHSERVIVTELFSHNPPEFLALSANKGLTKLKTKALNRSLTNNSK